MNRIPIKVERERASIALKDRVLWKLWTYLDTNFHKFKDPMKVKIAMALCTKSLPQEVIGGTSQKVIIIENAKKKESDVNNAGHNAADTPTVSA